LDVRKGPKFLEDRPPGIRYTDKETSMALVFLLAVFVVVVTAIVLFAFPPSAWATKSTKGKKK